MDRISWAGVVVCVLLLMFYQPILRHFYPPAPVSAPTAQKAVPSETPAQSLQPAGNPSVLRSFAGEIRKEETLAPEKKATLSNDLITAEFTTHGGAISRVVLKKHAAADDERVILNNGAELPMLNLDGWMGENTVVGYEWIEQTDKSITFARQVSENIRLIRKYTLSENYSIKLEQIVENNSAEKVKLKNYTLQVGLGAPVYFNDDNSVRRYISGAWWTVGEKYQSHKLPEFDGGGIIFKSKEKPFIRSDAEVRMHWATAQSQFFAVVLASLNEPAVGVDLQKIKLSDIRTEGGNVPDAVQTRLEMPELDVPAKGSVKREFNLYAGPKEDALLRKLPLQQDRVMEFGWLGFIARPLLATMNFINKFVGNYGVTIIILTILIKAILWIPQTKSNQSMRRMQALSPKLKELQEKHKDNPQRLQDEMMKLYRDYNVNPLGGCLPLLVQMPIFIGFYYMLLSAVELRHASFLWMNDLSQPDTVTKLPVFGMAIPINPMPLVMGATMYWSMNITPQPQSADNPTANMMKFMPLLILLICYNFSSALSLYWTVQNILSIGQMYYNLKQPQPKLEKVAHPQQSHKPSKTKGFFETLHTAHKEAQKRKKK